MSHKIESLKLKNYGTLKEFSCEHFSNINLIIGENGTGKTFLLKALYSAMRTLEEYRRGDDIRSDNDILADKLRWTFQTEKIGDLVTKGADEPLQFSSVIDGNSFSYQFSKDASSKVINLSNNVLHKEGNSICIPAKEVLSLFPIIQKSRDLDKSFGFDDCYYDLVKALKLSPSRGKNFKSFSKARKIVKNVINGQAVFEENVGKWYFKSANNQKYAIGATSEGVKKIAILDRLLANGYLDKNSVIFIDEIESALHPGAICQYLDIINSIAQEMDIQIFITSHSYFVIKKLFVMALKQTGFVTCISLNDEGNVMISDLCDGMPDNSIIQTSVRLYEEEFSEAMS